MISRQKVSFHWVSSFIPNFLAPTPSRGRPPPHQKTSGPKSLGLCSFFVPDFNFSLFGGGGKGGGIRPGDGVVGYLLKIEGGGRGIRGGAEEFLVQQRTSLAPQEPGCEVFFFPGLVDSPSPPNRSVVSKSAGQQRNTVIAGT